MAVLSAKHPWCRSPRSGGCPRPRAGRFPRGRGRARRCVASPSRRAAPGLVAGSSSSIEDAGPERVVDVVVDVGDAVDDADDLSSGVSGSVGPVWLKIPSRTSVVRFRPWPSFSSTSTMRRECSLWRKPHAELLWSCRSAPLRRCGRTACGRDRDRARSPRRGLRVSPGA